MNYFCLKNKLFLNKYDFNYCKACKTCLTMNEINKIKEEDWVYMNEIKYIHYMKIISRKYVRLKKLEKFF